MHEPDPLRRATAVDFGRFAAEVELHQDSDGNTHIHLRRDGSWLHMFHQGAVELTGQLHVSFLAENSDRLLPVARAVRKFASLISPGTMKFHRADIQFDDHLRHYVIALDAHIAGHSHREIACILHGEAYVSSRWSNPSADLKSVVRRAVRRGERLRDGDYVRLLK